MLQPDPNDHGMCARNVGTERELPGRCSTRVRAGTDWCTLALVAQRAWFAAVALGDLQRRMRVGCPIPRWRRRRRRVQRQPRHRRERRGRRRGRYGVHLERGRALPAAALRGQWRGDRRRALGNGRVHCLDVAGHAGTSRFTTRRPTPGARVRISPGAETHIGVATVGRDIIVVGGFSGTFSNGPRPPDIADVWRWSAADGAWNPGPPLPSARAAFACGLVGNQLHIAGGLGPDGASDAPEHFVWDITAAPGVVGDRRSVARRAQSRRRRRAGRQLLRGRRPPPVERAVRRRPRPEPVRSRERQLDRPARRSPRRAPRSRRRRPRCPTGACW